jgi:hypothetical protein
MEKWNYLWWELPQTENEIKEYIQKKFQFSGDHVWMKLLKTNVEKRLLDTIKGKSVEAISENNEKKKG